MPAPAPDLAEPLQTQLAGPPPAALPEARPVAAAARLPSLDALRGLALLGVLAVNLPVMAGPQQRFFSLPWAESAAPAALAATHLLFAGKAYALLAFLFGAGLALQAGRLGPRADEVLTRRLGALGAIGAAHGLLLWHGDILAAYAVVGFAWLHLFRGLGEDARLRWALALLLVLPVLASLTGGLLLLGARPAPGTMTPAGVKALEEEGKELARALAVYGQGPAGAIFAQRAADFVKTFFSTLSFLPQLLGLFLAGGWAAEKGLLARPADHAAFLARVALAGITAGLAGEAAYAALVSRGVGAYGATTLGYGIHALSAPLLALGGTAALLLLWAAGRARLLLLLAPLGRLSLTAYLSQSLLFTTLAYGYGAGLYGTLAPDVCLGLAAATWLVQAALAPLVLSRFSLGPAGWLWRRMTYGAAHG